MPNNQEITNPIALMLSRFIDDSQQRSMIVRGAWGVGKTYAIQTFLNQVEFHARCGIVARSNVSLFGKQSLQDVQASIFSIATQVGSDEDTRARLGSAALRLIQLEKYIKQSKLQKALRFLNSKLSRVQLPWIGSVGEMLSYGNYRLIDSFIVVLDDLERRSSTIPLKDVLGLIDDLSQQRNCKVIAICNEDALDNDERELLADFKEKVFDLDLLFTRAPRDIAKIGLPESCSHREISEQILEKLGISNIRVAKRYAFLVDQLWEDVKNADTRIIQEVLEHVAILTWARYDSTAGIPESQLGQLASESSWMASALLDGKHPKEEWQVNWESAASALQFSFETYDIDLVQYLRTGIWFPGTMAKAIAEKGLDLNKVEASSSMRAAWRIYADSLNPDKEPFVNALTHCIERFAHLLPPRDVDSAFAVLEDMDVDVTPLVELYMKRAEEEVKQAALEDWPYGEFKSLALRPIVERARSSIKVLPTLDAALARIALERSWSEEDILTLDSCTEQDFVSWMKSGAPNLSNKIKNGLLYFRSQSSDPRYRQIGEKAVRALRVLGRQSEINKIRVESIYNVRLDADE